MELAAIAVSLYFVPAIVAAVRRHRNAGAIFLTNLLLGWTLLGWAVALIWSATANTAEPRDKSAPAGGILGMMERRKAERIDQEAWVKRQSGGLSGLDDVSPIGSARRRGDADQ